MRTRRDKGSDNPLRADLEHVLEHTEGLWDELRGERLFVTGGTGFFGRWLLESFAWANDSLNLNASALVLTRDLSAFQKATPHLASHPSIAFHVGDVRDFAFPKGEFSHIIHAATTSAVATFNNEDPLTKFDTVSGGTRHTLDFAVGARTRRLLLTSSGAVYGRQPEEMARIPEDYCGAPGTTDQNSALGQAKRSAEFLCTLYSMKHGIETKIARCFSFVGPYLPLDIHYAIGNFIGDGLKGGPIHVKGDGTPYRSYLYAADLSVWLWTILFRGRTSHPYNVGSEAGLSISELARVVAGAFQPRPIVKIARRSLPEAPPERYVPDTSRAKFELGLDVLIDLPDAIRRTVDWNIDRANTGH